MTSIFVAILYELDVEVFWIDLLALIQMLAFYECEWQLQNVIMPQFIRFLQGTFSKNHHYTLLDIFEDFLIDFLLILVFENWSADMGKWADFYFNFGNCKSDPRYYPFFHKITRSFGTN